MLTGDNTNEFFQADRNDEHLDRKLDILSRGIVVHEDHPDETDHRITELEDENAALHRNLAALERELHCRSPTKAQKVTPLRTSGMENAGTEKDILQLKDLDLSENGDLPPAKTPGRKIRKLTPRTQGVVDENFDMLSSP